MRFKATAAAALVLMLAPPALAQDLGQPVEEGVAEQSCRSLTASTLGSPDQLPAEPGPGIPATWTPAPAGLLPDRVVLRTPAETFNRRYEFATRAGRIYGRNRGAGEPWREMPLPACFAGRVAAISLDDDEMIALDTARRVYTMDNALKDGTLFNWTSRWGTPFWLGPGYSLPSGVVAWSWSVVSPLEDKTWTDPAQNRTPIGAGKVSHIWGLRSGGQRLTFWDPWLPLDESYEMCGPHRGRFRAVNLSASGSFVFVVGPDGDLFTRLYDFDISGHDPVFFAYSYEDQRGKGDGSPIQLPAAPWVEQPKVPGAITSAISIHKVGEGTIHRTLRVEGTRDGRTGYWERDAAAPSAAGWTFHATGRALVGRRLPNPRRDTSARALGRSENARYSLQRPGVTAELLDFNVYCSPADLRVRENGTERRLRLHHVDGLRQQARGRGLDEVPRLQEGVIEHPGGRFQKVTVEATRSEVVIPELGWRLRRAPPRSCLARRAPIGRRNVGRVRLGLGPPGLLRTVPPPRSRRGRSWRWCVDGSRGKGVVAVFRAGRIVLVATTAPGHGNRGVRPGARAGVLRRVHPGRRTIGRGVLRAGPRSPLLFGVGRGRIRWVAVTSPGTIARRRLMRAYLRSAGLARR